MTTAANATPEQMPMPVRPVIAAASNPPTPPGGGRGGRDNGGPHVDRDRGTHQLPEIADPWPVFAVSGAPAG
jgi:hypothetical protein